MGFFLQLQLLLWKNFILRKRNVVRMIVEICWPLFLFIILVLVRTRGLRSYHHTCYFDEKAMPSAGMIPYVQSFLCTFNNTCYDHEQRSYEGIQYYNDSFISQLFTDVNQAFDQNMNSSKSDALARTVSDIVALERAWRKITPAQKNGEAFKGFEISESQHLLKDPKTFQTEMTAWMLKHNMTDDSNVLPQILNSPLTLSSFDFSSFMSSLSDPNQALCDPKLIGNLFSVTEGNFTTDELEEFFAPFCNLTVTEAREVARIISDNTDAELLFRQINEFLASSGDDGVNFDDWLTVVKLGADIRDDLVKTASLRKIAGDLSNMLRIFWSRTDALKSKNSSSSASTDEDVDSQDLVSSFNKTTEIYARLQKLFCGRNIPVGGLDTIFGTGGDRFEEMRNRFKLDRENKTKVYVYDNSTSTECNDIMKSFEEHPLGQILWKLVKPYIRGKILYTPDNPATRKLINLVNASFEPVAKLRNVSLFWINNKETIRNFLLDENNLNTIKGLFVSREPGNILDRIFHDPVTKVLNETGSEPLLYPETLRDLMDSYFGGNFNETWNSTLNQVDDIMSNISLYTSCFDFDKFVGVSSERELEKQGMELVGQKRLWAGLVFTNVQADAKTKELPTYVRYKIRMDADAVDSTFFLEDRINRPGPRARKGIDLKYIYFGFAFLQDLLEHAIIAVHSGRNMSDLPGISLQQFPYPCYIEDQFVMAISRTFPLFMTLSWVYTCAMIIKSIVHEKEERLKEIMKVMGLGNGVHWAAWFIDSFVFMILSVFLLTIILKYGKVITFSDPTLIFAFMTAYALATISFSFLLSTLFSRANIAAAAGGMIFFCTYMPYSLMVAWESEITYGIKIATSLVSNIAFGLGCGYFASLEEEGVGAQWDNIWVSPQQGSGDIYSLGGCIGMLLLDAFIYGVLTWYIEAVFPGQYGVPRPWYFCVTPRYWFGSKPISNDGTNISESDLELGETGASKFVEREPTHLPLGVSVKHLHKIYPNGKVAIEDLNVNFYESQITSFLGHNGAGKTTTISILTGMFPPSAGTAKIYGKDIRTSMDEIRQSVGLCPQHNVLFENLTVAEHLWFYARLKGKASEDIYAESNHMIEDLGLPHKRDEKSKNLSGGMQRKLSIASAFVGGSRVVILDEPTAGVDPYSRRGIWDLLIKYKEDRTIIMSTHFMDEADLLGDRIAIINNGKLVCCGSSLYLKSLYGNGYYLTLVRDDGLKKEVEEPLQSDEIDRAKTKLESDLDTIVSLDSEVERSKADLASSEMGIELQKTSSAKGSNMEEDLDLMLDDEGISDVAKKNGFVINPSKAYEQAISYPITKFVTKYVPNARLLDHFGSELVYILPVKREEGRLGTENFEQLFKALDQHMTKLQICSYGLSDTTLEEIFLKVASNVHDGSGGLRQIQYDDVTDGGRYAARTRSASTRSLEARNIFLPQDQQKVLGVAENPDEDESAFSDRREMKKKIGDGKTFTYTEVPTVESEKPKSRVTKNFPAPKPEHTSQALIIKHLVALEVKRFHYARRNKKGFICEILLPAIFVCLAMIFTLIIPPLKNESPLELHPWNYPAGQPDVPTSTFMANRHPKADWPRRYESQLFSKTGMGARCLPANPMQELLPCTGLATDTSNFSTPQSVLDNIKLLNCSCKVGTMECPENAEGPIPPKVQIASHDYVYNMTGRNISDYLLKTTKEFKKRRYGGFEFGVRNPLAGLNMSAFETFVFGLTNSSGLVERLRPSSFITPRFVSKFIADKLEDFSLKSGKLDNVRVWFNNKGWTSSMGYMNAANNLILRASIKAKEENDLDFMWVEPVTDASQYGISVINHPMNFTAEQMGKESIRQIVTGLLHAVCIIFALSFVPASFVLFLIEERVTKMKHLQYVSSVRPITYWVASVLWDLSMYMVTAIICVLIFVAFNAEAYISGNHLPALIVLLFLFGWATIPLMYPANFFFKIPSSAFVTLSCINLFIGIVTTVVVFVLENFDDPELKSIGNVLKQIFLIFPQYCLGRGLLELAVEYNAYIMAKQFGLSIVRNSPFAYDFVGKYLLFLFIEGIAFFLFTLFIEYKLWTRIRWFRSSVISSSFSDEDEDVNLERKRILESSNLDDVLIVRKLSKRYPGASKLAVDNLTFGVKRGECFGLLGVNGAGKTSTFKMLTGDTQPTSGTATVNGFNIKLDLTNARRNIGYCPQFDALNPLLTGREHLRFYARLRGLSENSVNKFTEWGLKRLGLTPYADRCAGTYSGGNKRKLSTAIALIGNPALIFLDEPTTGMDPAARRLLWNCILDMIRNGQSVVLTSHSMEECEALCTRLAIMVNGQFQCLGSIQHLKNRFGSGYTLTVRCGVTDPDVMMSLRQYVESNCPAATLQQRHVSQLQFHLPLKSTKLSEIFHIMENARSNASLNIEDYSISQLTLDEVFIQFASRQSETIIDRGQENVDV